MKRLLITAGLCLIAQGSFAGEGDRPVQRPTLCRVEGSQTLRPCTVVWEASYRVEQPVQRPVKTKAPKITRLPWMIGVFQ